MRRRVGLLLGALLLAVPLHAQRPQAAVVPQSITVGDVFHAAIRIELPAGSDIAAPDSLALPADLEQAGRREIRYDTAGGARRATVLYPLTAWRPGAYTLPPLTLQVVGDGRRTGEEVAFPAFDVASVLPADTAQLEPKGAKDVLGASRVWWPILLGLLAAALAAFALWWWWRRRRAVEEPVPLAPVVPPRQAALARLNALRSSGLLERGEMREYYGRLTEILRHYAAAVDPAWSVDLTTSELTGRMRAAQRHVEMLELVRILGAADLVKFARVSAPADAARGDLDAARAWVERTGPRSADAASHERQAA